MPMPNQTETEFDRLFETIYDGSFRLEQHIQVIATMYAINRKRYNEFATLAKTKCKSEYIKMENQLKHGGETTQARTSATHLKTVDNTGNRLLVKEVYPACPVSDDAVVPPGWAMRSNEHGDAAIVKLGDGETKAKALIGHPLVVTAVLSNILTGEVILEIAWQFHAGGSWKVKQIAKSVFGSKQRLAVEMASWGTAVTANNAGGVIEWLTDYQTANTGAIAARKTAPQLGWCRGGFLLPDRYIVPTDADTDDIVQFVPESDGIAQIRDALKPRGKLSGWIAAVAQIADYPLVTTGIYAALSSVLVESLMSTDSNPIIDWSYRTSTGKTTTLQIAASVWGDPRDMIVAWDGTQQGLTGRAIAMNHLPTIIDDSKTAREYGGKSSVPRVIYALSGGTDSVRNSTTGLKKTYRFRTVALSTGEDKAVDADKSGGTVARVLSIWGSPFGGESDEIKQRINRAKIGIDANAGLAGPVFVEHVVKHLDEIEIWKTRLDHETRRVQDALAAQHGVPGGILDRSAKIVALLQVTASIAHECLPLPWTEPDLVALLAPLLASDTTSVNRDQEAMDWILGRVASSPGRTVSDPSEYEKTMGSTSLLGIVGLPDCRIAMFPPALDTELRAGGFNPKSILRTWFENGWAKKGSVSWLHNGEQLVMLGEKES